MENERKKESFIERIKAFFKKLFKKENVVALPESDSINTVEETKENIETVETDNTTAKGSINNNKEEMMKLYNDVISKKVDVKTLTREQLIMFITLAKEEIKILEKKIDNEITEANMYKKDIEFYETKLGEEA